MKETVVLLLVHLEVGKLAFVSPVAFISFGSWSCRQLAENALENFRESKPVVIRLNGLVQFTDRLAIREIACQVVEQTGSHNFRALSTEDDANPFIEEEYDVPVGFLPPPAHLPSLVAALPTLGRPVVVLLDAFDRFANQPRQGLLYCLLDTVQSCRVGCKGQSGLAVIGLTARVDVINTLEKRVKSRFSHRIFRTAGLPNAGRWISFLKDSLLQFSPELRKSEAFTEWRRIWETSVRSTLESREVRGLLDEILDITRDIRYLLRIMVSYPSKTPVFALIFPLDPFNPSTTPVCTIPQHFLLEVWHGGPTE